MSNTIWVTGSEGFVGSYVMRELRQSPYTVIGTSLLPNPGLQPLDITRATDVTRLAKQLQPEDIIIHTAARPHVDWCEQYPAESHRVNFIGTKNLVEAARHCGVRLLFVSSEYVFDGSSGPYRERDRARPLNEYGRQKLAAEQYIASHLDNYLVVRTTTVFGYETDGKNFLMSLFQRARNQNSVLVPEDQISTPTFVEDLAKIIVDAAQRPEIQGILHVAGPECMSRFQFAQHITRIFDWPVNRLHGVVTPMLGQVAQRPLRAGLRIDRLYRLKYTVSQVSDALYLIKQRYGNQLAVNTKARQTIL